MEIRYEYHEPETPEEQAHQRRKLQLVYCRIFDAVLAQEVSRRRELGYPEHIVPDKA